MSTTKVAITLDKAVLAELDRLVEQHLFPSRSKAVQEAIQDKLARLRRIRLASECAKLSPQEEQAFAEEGLDQELAAWPEY
jgi:metal-responsive CopG/Arc/MetJ family transcriptional regulator